MGFSLSAAAAIVGVSALIAVEILIGNLLPTITNVNDSYGDMKDRAIDQVQTDINITNVNININGSGHDINITVENTGSISLKTSDFNILINGSTEQFTCSNSYLYPENEVYFNVTNSTGNTGLRRLKVVTDNGIADYYEYIVA